MARKLNRLLILLLGVALLALAGCGRESVSTVSSGKQGAAAGARDLAPLRVAVETAKETDPEIQQQAAVNEVIRQNMQTSYAKIETVFYPVINGRDANALEAVVRDLKSEGAPDVLILRNNTSTTALDNAGALFHLNKAIADRLSAYEELLYKSAVQSVRWQGNTIGIPRTLDPYMILYQKEHFAKAEVEPDPEWNWEDFIVTSQRVAEAAKAIYAEVAKEGKRVPPRIQTIKGAGSICSRVYCWLPFLLSNGGGYLENDLETIRVDSKGSVDALAWLQAQFEKGSLQGFATGSILSPKRTFSFAPAQLSTLNYLNATDEVFAALPFPKSPYTDRSVTTVFSSMYVVNAHSKNLDLALDFVLASLSRAAQERVAVETGLLPVRKDVDLPPSTSLPPKELLAKVLDDAWVGPPEWLANRYVFTLPFSTLQLSRITPEDAAAKAAKDLRSILEEMDKPEPYHEKDPNEGWFGTPKREIKYEQDPPPRGFAGVTVRWLGSSWSRESTIPLLDEFNKKATDTGIYVHLMQSEDLEGYTPTGYFQKSLKDGEPVDLVGSTSISLPELIEAGLLEPLDHYLRFELAAIPDGGILDQARYQGKLYEVPLLRVPMVVVARRSAWDRAGFAYPTDGWSWEEFERWAQKASDVVSGEVGVATPSYVWLELFYQMGGKLSRGPYEPLNAALPLARMMMESYPEENWADTYGPDMADVVEGKAVAYVGQAFFHGLRDKESLWDPLDTVMEKADLVVLPFPTMSGNLSAVGSYSGSLGVPKDAPHKEAAIKFLQWLLSAEASTKLTDKESGYFPVGLYPQSYESLQDFLGPEVKSILPVPFACTNEIGPNSREVRNAAYDFAVKYFDGEMSLTEGVVNMSSELPLIANKAE